MKRFLVLFAALSFLFCGSVFTSEATNKKPAAAAKETTMSATGKVKEISDVIMKIERTIKGKAEIMEFALDKTYPKISVGDKVKVSYITKDGKNVSTRLTKKESK